MAAYILKETNPLRRHSENKELACARKVSRNAQQGVHDKAMQSRPVAKSSHTAPTKPNQHESTVEKTAGAEEADMLIIRNPASQGVSPFLHSYGRAHQHMLHTKGSLSAPHQVLVGSVG